MCNGEALTIAGLSIAVYVDNGRGVCHTITNASGNYSLLGELGCSGFNSAMANIANGAAIHAAYDLHLHGHHVHLRRAGAVANSPASCNVASGSDLAQDSTTVPLTGSPSDPLGTAGQGGFNAC